MRNPLSAFIPPARARRASDVLERIVMSSGDVRLAVVSTPDGFEIASSGTGESGDARRLAAMAGSMMAMAGAMGREVRFGDPVRLTFETRNGVAVLQASGGEFPSLLCMLLEPSAVLGRALHSAGAAAALLAQPV